MVCSGLEPTIAGDTGIHSLLLHTPPTHSSTPLPLGFHSTFHVIISKSSSWTTLPLPILPSWVCRESVLPCCHSSFSPTLWKILFAQGSPHNLRAILYLVHSKNVGSSVRQLLKIPRWQQHNFKLNMIPYNCTGRLSMNPA